MFPLVLVWMAALVGPAFAYPVGQGDWSLANDLSWGDPWDTYHGPWSLDYNRGLLGTAALGGLRAGWPFDRSGSLLTSDSADTLNPSVLGSDVLFRPYDNWHGYPGVAEVAVDNYARGSGFGGAGGIGGGVGVGGTEVGVRGEEVFQPRWRGKYYNGLRFGGVRGAGWSDYDFAFDRIGGARYYSNLGTGTARNSMLRYGGDQVFLRR